jgi:glutamate-1-semialdehyde 2,1-aminomutase
MAGIEKNDDERQLIERARKVLPAGGFGNFPPDVVIRSGKGGRAWDVSGNEYVDFLLGSGPMFIGHDHPAVRAAVEAQLPLGTTFFATNEHGIALAEAICEAVACADKVRFVSSGTEADMYAMRLARAHRGRDKILKFEGGYHGMSDYALMSLAPQRLANFPQAVPDSAGLSPHVRDDVLVAPFNDAETACRMIAEYADDLGGVIVEPFQRLIPPRPGFLQALRDETARHNIPLIFDEVVTGFRFAYGGAQEVYGVTPDLCTLGKIIGGGFPLAAVAGREDIMAHFDISAVGSENFTFQVGTLSGNPVAAAAGLATLEVLREPGAYDKVYANGQRIMDALEQNLRRVGIDAVVVGQPTLFDVLFLDGAVNDYRDVLRGDARRQKRFNVLLRERGLLKGDSKFYMSTAHDAADVAHTIAAIGEAVDVLASEG